MSESGLCPSQTCPDALGTEPSLQRLEAAGRAVRPARPLADHALERSPIDKLDTGRVSRIGGARLGPLLALSDHAHEMSPIADLNTNGTGIGGWGGRFRGQPFRAPQRIMCNRNDRLAR